MGAGPLADDPDIGIVEQRLAALDRDLGDDVHQIALEGQHARLEVLVEDPFRAVRQRLRPPIAVEAGEGGADLGRVFLQLEGAGADEVLLEIAGIVGRDDDGVVVVGGDDVGEVAVGRVEMEGDGVVVDLLGPTLGQRALEGGERVGGVLRIGQAVDGGDHVVGLHLVAVVELHALADLEGPDRAVLIGLPALGQDRLQPEIGAGDRQELAGLQQHHQPAIVVDGDGIDGARRQRGSGADGAAGLGGAGGRRKGRGPQARDAQRPGQGREQRHAQAQHRAMAQEFAAVDPPRGQFIDEVVLDLAHPAA